MFPPPSVVDELEKIRQKAKALRLDLEAKAAVLKRAREGTQRIAQDVRYPKPDEDELFYKSFTEVSKMSTPRAIIIVLKRNDQWMPNDTLIQITFFRSEDQLDGPNIPSWYQKLLLLIRTHGKSQTFGPPEIFPGYPEEGKTTVLLTSLLPLDELEQLIKELF